MPDKPRWPEPPPDVIEAGMNALAEALMDQYPRLHAVVVKKGDPLRPGARRLPGALPPRVNHD